MKNLLASAAIGVALLAIGSGAQAASNQCLPIGGTGLGKMYTDNQLVAAMAGTFTGARAEIKSQTKTETGVIAIMEHVFVSGDNGFVRTRDKAVFTAVPGKDQAFMLEISYTVVETDGPMAGYTGTFYSYGLMKMDEGKAVVRYKGEICK